MEVINPINEMNILSMKNMVDMALGTPEVGAVNFNILHTLLHAILSKLQLDESKVDILAETKDPTSNIIQISTPPYHGLQERIKILESQISNLNALPSNSEIIGNILDPEKKSQSAGIDTQRTVSDLWQAINIRKKVNANEEGIDRLSSMIDSILEEMKRLQADNINMKKQLDDMSNLKGVNDKVDGLQNDLADLLAQFNALRDKLNQYPSPEVLKNIVTWEALEKALKGIKDDMDELRKPTERIVVNMATEPMSRPPSVVSSGPSEACSEMLEKLGILTSAHDLLEKRVVVLEEEMPNKADKKDLENLKIPDDLLQIINQLKSQMEAMLASKTRMPEIVNTDSEAIARIRDIINSLQDKMNEINESLEKLTAENKDLLSQIEELFGITKDHEHRKADIEYVAGLMRMKADKSLLDTKVDFTLFDETTGNLHNLIDDVLKKLLAAEEELRNLLRSLAQDLNGKVDKDDLAILKEWIEKRLKALADKLKNLRGGDMGGDDDAAGLRKQLLQHFHCISCDRPVDVLTHGANYSNGLPEPKGLPPTKSFRPYATFELDAIRQHSKNMPETRVINPKYVSYGNDIVDVYQTPRPCGGSHTTTYPQNKKIVRLSNINNSFAEEEMYSRGLKEELDLHGADGHIYKGRFDRTQTTLVNNNNYNEAGNNDKLPPVTTTQRSQTATPRGGFVTSRPKSALKLTPRHASSGGSGRPSSARMTTQGPDSRPTSPNFIEEQVSNQQLIDHHEVSQSEDFGNEHLTNESIITSDNFNIEIINQPENEPHSIEDMVLL